MEFLENNFASCYSQFILLADFKENHTLSGFKNPYKNSSLFIKSILLNGKMRVENQIKTRVYACLCCTFKDQRE
jgi:hypothetical protein